MLDGRLHSKTIGIHIRQSTFFMDNRLLRSWGGGGGPPKKIDLGSIKKPVRVMQAVFLVYV